MNFRRICLFALTAFALRAAAAPGLPTELPLSAKNAVSPGETVQVRVPPLSDDVEEFELLLRYESPLVLTLRLTESEEPALRELDWRVPDLPAGRARLVLRCGGEGEEEEVRAVSAPFRIVPVSMPLDCHVVFRWGELWVLDGAPPSDHALRSSDQPLWSVPGGIPFHPSVPPTSFVLPAPGGVPGPITARWVSHSAPLPPLFSRLPQRRVLRV